MTCKILAVFLVFSSLCLADKFVFNDDQRDSAVTLIFQPFGLLDETINTTGESARDVYDANNQANILQWVRDSTFDADNIDNATNLAYLWWSWKNENVEISGASVPPELQIWSNEIKIVIDSTNTALDIIRSEAQRNIDDSVGLYGESSEVFRTLGAGSCLRLQEEYLAKVRRVLLSAGALP